MEKHVDFIDCNPNLKGIFTSLNDLLIENTNFLDDSFEFDYFKDCIKAFEGVNLRQRVIDKIYYDEVFRDDLEEIDGNEYFLFDSKKLRDFIERVLRKKGFIVIREELDKQWNYHAHNCQVFFYQLPKQYVRSLNAFNLTQDELFCSLELESKNNLCVFRGIEEEKEVYIIMPRVFDITPKLYAMTGNNERFIFFKYNKESIDELFYYYFNLQKFHQSNWPL